MYSSATTTTRRGPFLSFLNPTRDHGIVPVIDGGRESPAPPEEVIARGHDNDSAEEERRYEDRERTGSSKLPTTTTTMTTTTMESLSKLETLIQAQADKIDDLSEKLEAVLDINSRNEQRIVKLTAIVEALVVPSRDVQNSVQDLNAAAQDFHQSIESLLTSSKKIEKQALTLESNNLLLGENIRDLETTRKDCSPLPSGAASAIPSKSEGDIKVTKRPVTTKSKLEPAYITQQQQQQHSQTVKVAEVPKTKPSSGYEFHSFSLPDDLINPIVVPKTPTVTKKAIVATKNTAAASSSRKPSATKTRTKKLKADAEDAAEEEVVKPIKTPPTNKDKVQSTTSKMTKGSRILIEQGEPSEEEY